jgi:hypothetical protein
MFVSIVITALLLDVLFALLAITPESHRAVEDVSQFALDYTFYLNLLMIGVAGSMIWLHRGHVRGQPPREEGGHDHGGPGAKRLVVWLMMLVVGGGLLARLASSLLR